MNNSSTLLFNLVAVAIASVLGALVLKPMAKRLGGIPHASFGNAFVVCLLSTSMVLCIWYAIGEDALQLGMGGILLLNLGLLLITYVPVGKLVWKTSWGASLKANAIWLIIAAALSGFAMYKMAEFM